MLYSSFFPEKNCNFHPKSFGENSTVYPQIFAIKVVFDV